MIEIQLLCPSALVILRAVCQNRAGIDRRLVTTYDGGAVIYSKYNISYYFHSYNLPARWQYCSSVMYTNLYMAKLSSVMYTEERFFHMMLCKCSRNVVYFVLQAVSLVRFSHPITL